MNLLIKQTLIFLSISIAHFALGQQIPESDFIMNDQEYFEKQGVNVMAFHDFYPEGHQGGVTIIQNGTRVAANGDVRLEATPGQWQPVPKMNGRVVNSETKEITVNLSYPDESKNRKGFNPVDYPDLEFSYDIRVSTEGATILIAVDLQKPLPKEWIGKVGFNLELFPGLLYGKSYLLDEKSGIFPRQLNGPMYSDQDGVYQNTPLATGKKLVIAPELETQRMVIETISGDLELLDGRAQHNNGWYNVRTSFPEGKTKNAIQWKITPNAIPNFKSEPVIHLSQLGYHPSQPKVAVVELDKHETEVANFELLKMSDGKPEVIKTSEAQLWGPYLRYNYYQFNFDEIKTPGIYQIKYGNYKSQPFKIGSDIYERHVWQPTLEYFLPVQMCHMRVNDRYRVWHGLCHMDDALMAPINHNHFDGYIQGASTLTKYKSYEQVPGLAVGGWHDAGDYDLRVESQIGTVYILSLAYEQFREAYDETLVDQENKIVELHQPDGKPDMLQQIEHGILTVLGGYKNLGRLYRGIICPDLRQYVLLGDGSVMTDNRKYNSNLGEKEVTANESGVRDDRLVFTEENPSRELHVVKGLAAASRVLKSYNPALSAECLTAAESLWETLKDDTTRRSRNNKLLAVAELYLTTQKDTYKNVILENTKNYQKNFSRSGWVLGRVIPILNDKNFTKDIASSVADFTEVVTKQNKENPFGIPYTPYIWGSGWNIQSLGFQYYFLHEGWPEVFPKENVYNAFNFILGNHPGENTVSYASGVGSNSLETAYGINRVD
ncbi:MAG: glycoside hydrolase family 9 protein, partial [Flammeovirgaceae bacterium]|nr:glycoside hydrolase family 9 protein [Flammeovirgaceae bacterium]